MGSAGKVTVWVADLSQVPNRLHGPLSAAERERAQRLRNSCASRRWTASRAVLRDLLGQAMGTDPAALQFELGPHGKPYAYCFQKDAPRFNMSHSGGLAVYALSWDSEVGVDVEMLDQDRRTSRNELAIAERMLSPEVAARLRSLPPERRAEEFLRAWVAHEALVKCLGHGLDGGRAAMRAAQASTWVTPLDVGEQAVAALAVQAGPSGVADRPVGVEGGPVGVEGGPVGVEGGPVGVEGGPVGVEGEPVGVEVLKWLP